MTTKKADEDQWLCVHDWTDTYTGSGLSKHTPDKTILFFFCKKCLAIRHKVIDTSEILLSPATLEIYEDNDDNGSDKSPVS